MKENQLTRSHIPEELTRQLVDIVGVRFGFGQELHFIAQCAAAGIQFCQLRHKRVVARNEPGSGFEAMPAFHRMKAKIRREA